MKNFQEYGKLYNLLYSDKSYSTEVDYIVGLLEACGIKEGTILEIGSGTGKHGRLLADLGFRVHGIEQSEEMVAMSEKTNGFTCECGDIRSVRINGEFDAVVSLFHVISYIVTNTDLQKVFSKVAKHLRKNGVFIFDFWYAPTVYSQKPETRVKKAANSDVKVTRIAEPYILNQQSVVEVKYTVFVENCNTNNITSFEETHKLRPLSLQEIDLLASANGLERIVAQEYMSGKSPGLDTWGVCVVLKRI